MNTIIDEFYIINNLVPQRTFDSDKKGIEKIKTLK